MRTVRPLLSLLLLYGCPHALVAPQSGPPPGPDARTLTGDDAGTGPLGDASDPPLVGVDAGLGVDARPGVDAGLAPLAWSPCAADGGAATCATASVPLRWAAPMGDTIELALERVGAGGSSTVALFINGGPGLSSRNFAPELARLSGLAPDLAFVRLDLRGTGRSPGVPCAQALEACLGEVQASEGLVRSLGTTTSARDLLAVAQRLAVGGTRVVVVGQSYGSFVVQRALLLEPDAFGATILDGAVEPGLRFSSLDAETEAVGRAVLEACARSTACASRFPAGPSATLDAVLDRVVEEAWCTRPLRRLFGMPTAVRNLQFLLSQLLATHGGAEVIPSAIAHVDRCGPTDEAALQAVARRLTADFPALESSVVTGYTVSRAEFWDDTTPPELRALSLSAPFSRVLWEGPYGSTVPGWPLPADDGLRDRVARPTRPVLILAGEFDAATTRVRAHRLALALGAAVLDVPAAPHGVLAPLFPGVLRRTGPADCVEQAALDVIRTGQTRSACPAAPLDFDLGPERARFWYGRDDAWP